MSDVSFLASFCKKLPLPSCEDHKAQNVVIEAMQNITLSVGGSYIAIESDTIEINTAGQLRIDGAQVQVTGQAQTSIQGGAMTEVKGGIVKIN
jgi:uncharacterized protein (DUF2345 family)